MLLLQTSTLYLPNLMLPLQLEEATGANKVANAICLNFIFHSLDLFVIRNSNTKEATYLAID